MVFLTKKEQKRVEVIQMVMDQRINVEQACYGLNISERQFYRIKSAIRTKGIEGIVHGNRGNQFALKWNDRKKSSILKLVRQKYLGFNDSHLTEFLAEHEKIPINRETLRRWLRSAGLKPKHKQSRKKYRSKRERKESFGTMLQIDASDHDWLQGRGPWITIVGGIDDATNYVWARFDVSENTWAYLKLFKNIIESNGVPLSIYSDRHTLLHCPKEPTIVEQIADVKRLTQFGRAMKELGITMIKAYSPQAKGRIERLWRTFQDRLIAEMQLQKISSLAQANLFLKGFLIRYNQKFTVPARGRDAVFTPSPTNHKLQRILCLKDQRVVNKDHTVSFEGLCLQIPPSSKWASIVRQKVMVYQLENGSIEIWYKNMKVLDLQANRVADLIQKYQVSNSQLPYVA